MADLPVVVQVGPTGGELNNDAAGRFVDTSGNFDQSCPPSAGLAFSERVVLSSAVMSLPALPARQRFLGNILVHRFRRWIGDPMAHMNQKVVSCRVQIQSKQVGEVAMVTETVCLKSTLHLLVPILAFTAIRVLIVCGTWQDKCSWPIGHHGPAVGALRVGFALDDDPSLRRP